MKATVERLKASRVRVGLEVEPDRVEASLDRAYRRVVQRINVPGFRKGKAPRPIVERQVGQAALLNEALEELVPEALGEALQEAQVEPLEQPKVDVGPFERGKPLTLSAELAVKPPVTLGEYRGLEAVRRIERVTDKEVDHVLLHMQEDMAELVEAGREVVEKGDYVVIDFEGFVGDQPFRGGAARGETVQVGGGRFIPGFEEQLIGMRQGEDGEVRVTFPADFRNSELAGKEALFKVHLHAIKVRRLPSLDDDFAQNVSECETLQALREQIRERLEKDAARRADEALQVQLAEQVAKAAEIEMPDVLVERQVDEMILDIARDFAARGQSLEAALERSGEGVAELRRRFQSAAEERVRVDLALGAVARAEGIAVTEAELQAEIERLIATANDKAVARSRLAEPGGQAGVRQALQMRKTLQFLTGAARVTDEWVDPAPPDHTHGE